MIKIGITGSIASGKTTASKILSSKRGSLFSADKFVKKLYKRKNLINVISNRLNLKINNKFKAALKNKILKDKTALKKLENILHPLVRKEMKNFLSINKNKKYLFFEIPLLIESKLMKYFDVIIFIKSKKNLRLKRYVSKKMGNKQFFSLLNDHQLKDAKKTIFCDHVVVNNKSLNLLKKNLLNIMKLYE